MGKIKEYKIGIDSANKIYFIDTNILLAMTQLYYKGKCKDEEITEEIKIFILESRKYGVQNQFSITEVCFDYKSNQMNNEQMNKIMIAYDNLLMNLTDDEIRNHKGYLEPKAKWNSKREYSYKSIFECNLPKFFLANNIGMIGIFYQTYLYFLKIYDLKISNEEPLTKIRSLFKFMTEDIDVFMGYEFYLGVMLFVGSQKEREISQGIFKPMANPPLDHILNTVIDIFQYRMACFIADYSVRMKMPMKAVFATMDIDLQKYIEHNMSYQTVMTSNMITPINHFEIAIDSKYIQEWDKFYDEIYYPILQSRFSEIHTHEIDKEKRKFISDKIRNEIVKYERIVVYNIK
ncbi:hypothetical protein [Lacrimispora sp. 38-1]|uniref:hypothetical protein n=1 Tax=Lacrimispora sp. 38-1 TaxID=3125778 RepID=UPI003CF0AA13